MASPVTFQLPFCLDRRHIKDTPLKAAFERGLEEILTDRGGNRSEAIFQTAAKIGATVLARAPQDTKFADEILSNVREKLA